MYILYGGGVSRAAGPQMVLEEAGLAHELRAIDIDAGEHRRAAFLAVNPAGYVPALVTPGGETLHEAAAIMLYLADRHRLETLAPVPADPLRGRFLSGLFYLCDDIQPPAKRFFYPARYSEDAADAPRIRARARAMARERWHVLDDALAAGGPFHLGERFSLTDIYMAVWAAYGLEDADEILNDFTAVRACFDRVAARPKSGPVLQRLRERIAAEAAGADA